MDREASGIKKCLQQILQQLRQIQEAINKAELSLEPSKLQWNSFLDQICVLEKNFQMLIEKTQPSLSSFLVSPTKADVQVTNLLNTNLPPELTSEEDVNLSTYLTSLDERGLKCDTTDERNQAYRYLLDNIEDHQKLVEQIITSIDSWIDNFNLKKKSNAPIPRRRPTVKEHTILKKLQDGTDLPPPDC